MRAKERLPISYREAQYSRWLARPALILSAADDPFVPPQIFDAPAVRNNPNITTVVTSCGGHCAFVETAESYDGYFAEKTIVDFLGHRLTPIRHR